MLVPQSHAKFNDYVGSLVSCEISLCIFKHLSDFDVIFDIRFRCLNQ